MGGGQHPVIQNFIERLFFPLAQDGRKKRKMMLIWKKMRINKHVFSVGGR
jgi:hypothetical protein